MSLTVAAPLRVLHCPWNISGHASGLAAGERALGLNSRAVAFEPGRFGFDADEVLWSPGMSAFAREGMRWRLLERALASDIVHFNWAESLFPSPGPGFLAGLSGPIRSRAASVAAVSHRMLWPWRDLETLRRAGKIIAVTFQGDDIRQGDRQRARYAHSLADVVAPGYYTPASDAAKRRTIAAFARHAHILYALNPDLLRDLPPRARFLPYACVDPAQIAPAPANNPRPLIVHAPSDRRVKGTEFVIAAVDALRDRGVAVDLDLVEGVDHHEAFRRYARADIFVDQLHAGFYGGAAVQAMAMGKAVVCYLRDEDLGLLSPAMRANLPIVNAEAKSIAEVLTHMLRDSDLAAIGARSRAYVERWHAPRVVAASTAADYAAARAGLPLSTPPL